MTDYPKFEDLLGKTLVRAEQVDFLGDDEIRFETVEGDEFKLYHSQDCCESVSVESIVGDLSDLVGSPILMAEEVTHSGGDGDSADWPEGVAKDYEPESYTWTFYKLATIKGGVTIRWFGSSNGYYSESVSFAQTSGDREGNGTERPQVERDISRDEPK